jgi:DNA repair protein RadC
MSERRSKMVIPTGKIKVTKKPMTTPGAIAEVFFSILQTENEIDQDKEHFWIMGMDTKNKIKYIELASLGTLNASLIRPLETYRLAIVRAVASIATIHNHPSGDPGPSSQDVNTTKQLLESGKILGIELLDHIIIGDVRDRRFFSFREGGLM